MLRLATGALCALCLCGLPPSANAFSAATSPLRDFATAPAHCSDPRDFGAKGDGKHNDGPAIQKALDDSSSDCTLLQDGTYLSSSLLVPSHTTFFFSRAVLAASPGVGGLTQGALLYVERDKLFCS
jgi:polygalacturonase